MSVRIALSIGALAIASVGDARAQQVIYTYAGSAVARQLGISVAGAGDANADGSGDYVIGIWGQPNGSNPNAGAAIEFSGATGGSLHTVQGSAAFEFVGFASAGAGDVDNDGVPDFIVGGYGLASGMGGARVYSGATGGLLYAHAGTNTLDNLGSAVCAAGDVDNDGFDDYVIASPGEPDPGPPLLSTAGAVRIFSGFDGSQLRIVRGTIYGGDFGASIAGGGDIDGDGIADLVVGAPYDDSVQPQAGRTFVFSGLDGSRLVTLDGLNAGDRFGSAVATGADFDGDGLDDLLIGSPNADGVGPDSGSAALFIGGTAPYAAQNMEGQNGNAVLGTAVCFAGDVDHDGITDYAFGAPGTIDPSLAQRGAAYLISGASGLPMHVSYGSSTTIFGSYGTSLDDAGDVNGDGFLDLIVGDPLATPAAGLNYAGIAAVLSGRCGRFVRYGDNCASPNASPDLYAFGCSSGGNTVTLGYDDGPSASYCIIFVGVAPAAIPMAGGCTLLVQLTPLSITLPLSVYGQIEVPIALPPGFPAVTVYLQGFSPDASAAAGFVASNGLEFAIE